MADIDIARQKEPQILQDSNIYINLIFTNSVIIAKNIIQVTHTGFSLGGFIAAASVAKHPFSNRYNTKGIVFDINRSGRLFYLSYIAK